MTTTTTAAPRATANRTSRSLSVSTADEAADHARGTLDCRRSDFTPAITNAEMRLASTGNATASSTLPVSSLGAQCGVPDACRDPPSVTTTANDSGNALESSSPVSTQGGSTAAAPATGALAHALAYLG